MTSSDPIILSIIIPAYNAAKTLERTLHSLEHITPEHRATVEAIVINDGSIDHGPSLARSFLSERTLGGRVIDQPNRGLAAARNTGLRNATGRWCYLLDADDELNFDPIPLLRRHRNATSILTSKVLKRRGKIKGRRRPPHLRRDNYLDVLSAANPLAPSSLIFRLDCIDHFNDEMLHGCADWAFWLTNPRLYDRVARLPDIEGTVINADGANMSRNHSIMGRDRERVAQLMLDARKGQLTRKQQSNFQIQRWLGRLQQGTRPPISEAIQWHASLSLLMKLGVYATLGIRASRFSFYR